MSFDDLTKRRFALLLIAFCVACKPSTPPPVKPAPAEPQVQATVVTIRTIVRPENKSWVRSLVIAGDRARDTGELDTWRLYDTKAKTVTFVDDVEKTFRTEALDVLIAKRETAQKKPLPAHYPHAELARTKEHKSIQGVTAERSLIESGAYRRELWLGEHPSIPRGLFGMMQASEAPSSPLAPMTRTVDEALISARGFPLSDRATVPLGDTTLVVERDVTGIGQQQVSQTVLAVPKGYRDLTPKAKPAAPSK
jgi:hypothetical protein